MTATKLCPACKASAVLMSEAILLANAYREHMNQNATTARLGALERAAADFAVLQLHPNACSRHRPSRDA